jgi:hypothetical protein
LLIGPDDFKEVSKRQYKAYVGACRTDIRWKVLYNKPEFCVGTKGVFWQEKLSNVNLTPVWNVLQILNRDGRFGFFIELAKHSRANVYKLQASSFVERVNSAGKIVLNDTNVKLAPDKVEKRVLLRMNRRWMAHMRATYKDINKDMMGLLRASHDALQLEKQDDDVTVSLPQGPLHMSMLVDDDPHWPQNHVLDEGLAVNIAMSDLC